MQVHEDLLEPVLLSPKVPVDNMLDGIRIALATGTLWPNVACAVLGPNLAPHLPKERPTGPERRRWVNSSPMRAMYRRLRLLGASTRELRDWLHVEFEEQRQLLTREPDLYTRRKPQTRQQDHAPWKCGAAHGNSYAHREPAVYAAISEGLAAGEDPYTIAERLEVAPGTVLGVQRGGKVTEETRGRIMLSDEQIAELEAILASDAERPTPEALVERWGVTPKLVRDLLGAPATKRRKRAATSPA